MRTAATVAGCVLSAALLAGQARFTTGAAAVRVDVLVTDGNKPVTGLAGANFELRDNGVPQQVADFSRETLPLNVIGVLDLSGSVSGEPLRRLKQGMMSLVDALEGKDRVALVTFSERLRIHSSLTEDRARLRQIIEGVSAGGATSFFDAAFAGLALREGDGGRTLLLLFSDGIDTASWLTAQQVVEAAQRSDVVVYPVTVKPMNNLMTDIPLATNTRTMATMPPSPQAARQQQAQRMLSALAEATGGRVVYADAQRPLGETFVEVLSEFRQRYVLSYSPSGVSNEGWHTIEVKLRGKKGVVIARRGYFASGSGAPQ
jgi:Ca-activated chloride channel homolog